jgi:hypothetical protein
MSAAMGSLRTLSSVFTFLTLAIYSTTGPPVG